MKSGNSSMRSAVLLGAILALGGAGTSGSTSELRPGWSSADNAVETQTMEQVVGGQYPAVFAVVLQAMCVQCVLDLTVTSPINWVAVAQCVVICNIAF